MTVIFGVCYTVCMKSRTNVSIDQSLLEEARAQGLVISAVLEEALRNKLREERALAWEKENREAISSYNSYVKEEGTFSDGIRSF